MAQLQHKFVTELEQAERILSSDFILLSQKGQDDKYMSRKLPYQTLCATVLNDIDDKISSSVSAAISVLTLSVENNISAISALSAGLGETTSAVIKIANCVQKNKVDISAVSAEVSALIPLKSISITGENGICAEIVGTYAWSIGHKNAVDAGTDEFAKFSYDAQGHVTGKTDVVSADITSLGNFITGAGVGISVGDHKLALKTATSSEIGGIKVNGNNVDVLEDGSISARDTLYTAGVGLSVNNANQFDLTVADYMHLGGIKVGNNLSIDESGTLCAAYIGPATALSAGVIQLGYVESEEKSNRNYKVQTNIFGNAYVTVPWTDTSSAARPGTKYTKHWYDVISAISFKDGNITELSVSDELYRNLSALSARVESTGSLSDCITVGNGLVGYEQETGIFTLRGGNPIRGLTNGGTKIPSVISGEIVTSAYIKGDGPDIIKEGLYIKLAQNTAEQNSDNIYIDVLELKDTVVEKVTYDHTTRKIVITFNDTKRSNISVYVGDLVDTYTAGTGLSVQSNQFYIPKTESWTFTLDNGTTTTRTVALI